MLLTCCSASHQLGGTSCCLVQEKAFELHHRQRERCWNPYAVTNLFGSILEDVSHRGISEIPIWIRAVFELEENFEEWNNESIAKMDAYNKRSAKELGKEGVMMREYRDSLEELEVCFVASYEVAQDIYSI
jgi:hypothetical protein